MHPLIATFDPFRWPSLQIPIDLFLLLFYYLLSLHNLLEYHAFLSTCYETPAIITVYHSYSFNMSFHSQRTGLGTCPSTLCFSIPLFQNSQFSYIPWQDVSSHKLTLAIPDITIPKRLYPG